MDPKEDDFPIEIKPETIVAKTNGAIIILINLKNTSVTILKYEAICVICTAVNVL